MQRRFGRRSGGRYTFISIVLIILMLYFSRFALGGGEGSYLQYVEYKNNKYEYRQTINAASYGFVRKYGASYEGRMLLVTRGENREEVPEKVYIFTGWRKYREYELVP